jgi:hypothetical protein
MQCTFPYKKCGLGKNWNSVRMFSPSGKTCGLNTHTSPSVFLQGKTDGLFFILKFISGPQNFLTPSYHWENLRTLIISIIVRPFSLAGKLTDFFYFEIYFWSAKFPHSFLPMGKFTDLNYFHYSPSIFPCRKTDGLFFILKFISGPQNFLTPSYLWEHLQTLIFSIIVRPFSLYPNPKIDPRYQSALSHA